MYLILYSHLLISKRQSSSIYSVLYWRIHCNDELSFSTLLTTIKKNVKTCMAQTHRWALWHLVCSCWIYLYGSNSTAWNLPFVLESETRILNAEYVFQVVKSISLVDTYQCWKEPSIKNTLYTPDGASGFLWMVTVYQNTQCHIPE